MSNEEYEFVTSKTPIPTVDLVILRMTEQDLETLIMRRKTGYEAGKWCIIGGRQLIGERTAQAIQRHASDLGVEVEVLAPFAPDFPAWINDNPNQDHTKHPITRVFPVRITGGSLRQDGLEFYQPQWVLINNLPEMAYDHRLEIEETLKRLRLFS